MDATMIDAAIEKVDESSTEMGRKRKRSESPSGPSSPQWFVRAFESPVFADVGLVLQAEQESSRRLIFEWEELDFLCWLTKEADIDVRDKNPDATYVADKRNNDMVLKRMQEAVENYKPQQEARPMATHTIQKNLLGDFLRSDRDESLQRNPGNFPGYNQQQQPSAQARSTLQLQTAKCEKDPSSPQTISCRARDLVSDDEQQKSTKSMGVRITWQNDSATAKNSWRMQTLVPGDIQQQPSAREAESRNALQHLETTQRIQRLGHVGTQQRPTKSMAFRTGSYLGSANDTTSWISGQIRVANDHQKQPSSAIPRTQRRDGGEMQHKSVKSMTFRTKPFQSSTSSQSRKNPPEAMLHDSAPASTSWRTQKTNLDDMQQKPVKTMILRSSVNQDLPNQDWAMFPIKKSRSSRARKVNSHWSLG